MGRILIILILTMTIPRWALTLRQVDSFALAGVPIAAIGEAVVLEIGNFYLLQVYNRCRARAIRYRADWEALDERNREQGKTTRKAKTDSVTAGYWVLPVALMVLEGLTVMAQTPFIAGELLGQSATSLLDQIHWLAVIAYAFILVISPGLMTVGIGFGVYYESALAEVEKEKAGAETGVRPSIAQALTARLTAGIERNRSTAKLDRLRARPTDRVPDRVPDRPTAPPASPPRLPAEPTGQEPGHWAGDDDPGDWDEEPNEDDEIEVSEVMAGHLQKLREMLARRAQIDPTRNGNFRRQDVEDLLGLGNTHAKNVIRYGLDHGTLKDSKKQYHYTFTN